jgi:isoleucyl-tRNA synthetase
MASKGYDFKAVEAEMLKLWEDNDIYPKLKRRNHGKPKFYFLQGPPYTSGRIHLGTAWNNSMKDMVLRYKRMRGFDVWDRGGYDMHGLPTENKVQAEHSLATKKDIVNFGVEKFINECIRFSSEKASLMNDDLWRFGVWMNHQNAYMPIHDSFIEGEWLLVKKAHEKNRLYKGKKVMTWCKSCETALAKHELEYQTVNDLSIFVKFKVAHRDDEYLIIWTTTPWTIPFNLAVMVNPDLDYVRTRVLVDEKNDKYETWIVSTALSTAFIAGVAGKNFEVIEEFKGEKLSGTQYEHPFHADIPEYKALKRDHKNVHTVILSDEYVDTSAGTGLVHCAPGCGPEDFEMGKRNNIPAFNDIDELGVFGANTGRFMGMTAKDDDKLFIDVLREHNALIETTYVDHEYAHCWRCHKPVVFRATEQWFFKTEDLKERMLEFNKDVYWYPETAKNAFDSWLKNLRDNSITKQRFWGTPVPIWQCSNVHCNKYEVIGSAAELKEKSQNNHIPNNLHKPWIDNVKIKCTCGHDMLRTPDVLDVWIDAGTTSWNCLDYPSNTELFEKYFPADFIIEGKDQIRGWFNLLMVASVLAFDKVPFRNVVMHGFITDVDGQKMSKSLGNIISPYEIVDKFGADTLRYYTISTPAGEDMSFSWDEVTLRHKNLIILWNLHNFIIDFKNVSNINLVQKPELDIEERYILSRLHSTIKEATEDMEKYRIEQIPPILESLYLDLSRMYIQLVREKSAIGTDVEKEAILYALHNTFTGIIKMFSIVCPFITEQIYQEMKKAGDLGHDKESIHGHEWPSWDEKLIDSGLERSMVIAQQVMQSILACRDKMNMGVRWPLAECIIDSQDKELITAVESLKGLISQQVNVKKITFKTMDVDIKVKPNFKTLGKDFGNMTSKVVEIINNNGKIIADHITGSRSYKHEGLEISSNHVIIDRVCPPDYEMAPIGNGSLYVDRRITKELEVEGYAREVMRRTQQLRKDSSLNKKDVIELSIVTPVDISQFNQAIKEKCGAKTISYHKEMPMHSYDAKSDEKIKGQSFVIMFNKL